MSISKQPKSKGVKFTTPMGRFSYPALFVPRPKYQQPTELEYTAELLFDETADLKGFHTACDLALTEVFGPKAAWPKNISYPLIDQQVLIDKAAEKGQVLDHLKAGNMFARFKSSAKNAKPMVVDAQMNEILDPTKVYGGAYGRISTHIKVWVINGKDPVTKKATQTVYITCYLQGAQLLKDGDSFGGRPSVSEMFEPVTFGESEESPLG